jgi:hypothetical protein
MLSQFPVFGHSNNKSGGVQIFESRYTSFVSLLLLPLFDPNTHFDTDTHLTHIYVLQQAQFASSLLGLTFTPNMAAERFSAMLSNFYIPEGGTLHNFDLLLLF